MARTVTVTLTDDLDNSQVADETVIFALDGIPYEIDLTEKNAAKLRALMGPFVAAARRGEAAPKAPQKPGKKSRPTSTAPGMDLAEIRTWARKNGHTVSDRGRIPSGIVQEFRAAQAAPAAKKTPAKKTGAKLAAVTG